MVRERQRKRKACLVSFWVHKRVGMKEEGGKGEREGVEGMSVVVVEETKGGQQCVRPRKRRKRREEKRERQLAWRGTKKGGGEGGRDGGQCVCERTKIGD